MGKDMKKESYISNNKNDDIEVESSKSNSQDHSDNDASEAKHMNIGFLNSDLESSHSFIHKEDEYSSAPSGTYSP